MLSMLVTLIVAVMILGLFYWFLSRLPIPDPFHWIVDCLFALICIVVILEIFFGGLVFPIAHGVLR